MTNIGYHFTGETLRDGSPIPPVGEKLVFTGKIEICDSGLHWSRHPFDALQYSPGKWLHLVECSDPVEEHRDKCVSGERTIIKTIDAEYLCRRFAADQALSVSHLWDMPDIVKEYLTTLDESKQDAAWAATQDAVRAAWDATWAAAQDAAWAAAWDATWAAAQDAARGVRAAWDATWAAQAAAWDATLAAARADFKARVDAAFKENDDE